jgi:hypothetical protein
MVLVEHTQNSLRLFRAYQADPFFVPTGVDAATEWHSMKHGVLFSSRGLVLVVVIVEHRRVSCMLSGLVYSTQHWTAARVLLHALVYVRERMLSVCEFTWGAGCD